MTSSWIPADLSTRARTVGNRVIVDIAQSELLGSARQLFYDGFRLALAAATDDDPIRVVHLFTASGDRRIELRTTVDRANPSQPSLAEISFPASRFERQMSDLFGITPVGHPQPAHLVTHRHWPDDYHPMLADAGPVPVLDDEVKPYPFLKVEGPGVFEIPVGPVHAGVIEPGHFRFSVVGETILNVKIRLWFTHKGVEKLFEGKTIDEALEIAQRVSGDTGVGHPLAFCLAVEEALGLHVSEPAQAHRAIALELERLYNHTTDIGAICNDIGYGIANAHTMRIREMFLRINQACTGHRLLRGAVAVGRGHLDQLPSLDELTALVDDLREVVDIATTHPTVVDRLRGTGILELNNAREIGTLGYVARASGLVNDARQAHPFTDLYDGFAPVGPDGDDSESVVRPTGDVMARFLVRVAEAKASLTLIESLLAVAADHENVDEMPSSASGPTDGVGIVEGWRGTIVHRVELDGDCIARLSIVDPSFFNWPALPVALRDVIVPDFPLTNKSFNLSYAGNDL